MQRSQPQRKDTEPASPTTPGRHSNPAQRPIQRRLDGADIDQLVDEYLAGRTLHQLAKSLGVHHHTVAAHLKQRGVPRRATRRKMNQHDVLAATLRYEDGDSLATVARAFNVDAATVRRELHQAGVPTRPRPGGTEPV